MEHGSLTSPCALLDESFVAHYDHHLVLNVASFRDMRTCNDIISDIFASVLHPPDSNAEEQNALTMAESRMTARGDGFRTHRLV